LPTTIYCGIGNLTFGPDIGKKSDICANKISLQSRENPTTSFRFSIYQAIFKNYRDGGPQYVAPGIFLVNIGK
jgi:hypothetical protein